MRIVDHEKGNMPVFFRKIWSDRYESDPVDDQIEYERLDNEQQKFTLLGMLGTFITFCVSVFFLAGLPKDPSVGSLVSQLLLLAFIVTFPATIIFWVMYVRKSPDRVKKWHHKEYFSSVQRLFQLFSIQPSSEIGKMSKEEFFKAITGSLKTIALEDVEPKNGFARVAAMTIWKRMHTEALKWGLCYEDYSSYFPVKPKPAPDWDEAVCRLSVGIKLDSVLEYLRQNPKMIRATAMRLQDIVADPKASADLLAILLELAVGYSSTQRGAD